MDATDTEKQELEAMRNDPDLMEAMVRYVKACIREPEQEREKKNKKIFPVDITG